ncbi:MAG: hypothetical protein J5J06_09285 [Phycisphaerae bacterium]|nr:hypothetical protein [Phycisphaerae bacterium]
MTILANLLPTSRWSSLSERHKASWHNYADFYRFRWVNDGSLKPSDLYCYLCARFGLPNGPTMASRSPTTENIYQWHFVVGCDNAVIHFISRVDRLEIVPEIDTAASPEEWSAFVTAIKCSFGTSGAEMAQVRKRMEKWKLFVNPFARLSGIISKLEAQLQDRSVPSLPRLPESVDPSTAENVQHALNAWSEQVSTLKTAGLATRMLVPVWGEAFVNLLLFVLARPELKNDRRIFESAIRQQIDVRIAALSVNCVGFARAVDRTHDSFVRFHTLMNRRNDILHGNIDPRALEFGTVSFDQVQYGENSPVHQVPVFEDDQNLAYRLLEGCTRDIAPKDALADIAIVRDFTAFMLDNLHPKHRQMVELVKDSEHLGWEDARERVGVLFPQIMPLALVDSP